LGFTSFTLQLFDFILSTSEKDLCVTTQLACDITQEFVYQFQGFCQYRCQVTSNSCHPDTIKLLEANRDAWTLPVVMSILKKLIAASKKASNGVATRLNAGPFIQQFGYFACIELARLECLTGDFSASLTALADIKLYDRTELFLQLPLCQFNVYYHVGVCNLMLRRYSLAIDAFSEIVGHVSKIIKPAGGNSAAASASATAAGASASTSGASGSSAAPMRAGMQQHLQRQLDKVLALTAIASFLCPSVYLEDQVQEVVESKYQDKMTKLQNSELYQKVLSDLFDFAAPKFISPAVPDYATATNSRQEAQNHVLACFLAEVGQQHSFMKLKTFLSLYASIDIAKLARFNDTPEADLTCQLLSFKNKSTQLRATCARDSIHDVHFFVDNGSIILHSGSAKVEQKRAHERYFMNGVKKHGEIVNQINRTFAAVGLK
jgi:translation initiation factor 3 subunit L